MNSHKTDYEHYLKACIKCFAKQESHGDDSEERLILNNINEWRLALDDRVTKAIDVLVEEMHAKIGVVPSALHSFDGAADNDALISEAKNKPTIEVKNPPATSATPAMPATSTMPATSATSAMPATSATSTMPATSATSAMTATSATSAIRANYQAVIEPELSEVRFSIPNASVGRDYAATPLASYADLNGKLRFQTVRGLSAVGGLHWNLEKNQVQGIPEKDGDFNLEIEAKLPLAGGSEHKVKGKLRLTIIPDPRSLWKTLDPDTSVPYSKSHSACDGLQISDGGRLLYASRRGRSHAHAGTYRDDDVRIVTDSNSGWNILAIADGAGSCSYSRRGSKIAVDVAAQALMKVLCEGKGEEFETAYLQYKKAPTEELTEKINSVLKQTVVSAAYNALSAVIEEAKSINEDSKSFSTTLLLAAHKHTSKGHLFISFWVGDGALVLYRHRKEAQLLGAPDSGEYAGQTRFLDGNLFRDMDRLLSNRVSHLLIEDFTALILATDGVSDPFFDTDDALSDVTKWDNLWQTIGPMATHEDLNTAAQELVEWLDFWAVGNHDDRSIALLLGSSFLNEEQTNTPNPDC